MQIESKELSDFIRSTIESIENGLKEGYTLSSDIEFELAVVNTKKGKGGLKLFVVNASADIGKESVSKIKFKIEKEAVFTTLVKEGKIKLP